MGANRVGPATRQAGNTRNEEREPMAYEEEGDIGEMELEGADVEEDMIISESTAEIEMGAAASND